MSQKVGSLDTLLSGESSNLVSTQSGATQHSASEICSLHTPLSLQLFVRTTSLTHMLLVVKKNMAIDYIHMAHMLIVSFPQWPNSHSHPPPKVHETLKKRNFFADESHKCISLMGFFF